jgi:hypothetical protein
MSKKKRKEAFDADVAKIREEMQQEERDAELREVLVGKASVELIRENADGSADYMFNFPPEAMAALTRLGIMTAIQAGVGEAKRYDPDYEEEPPAPVMDESIKCLAIEAGFIAWDEEEWHPADVVFDWAGADDESLINFYHLVRKEAVWECIKQLEIGKKGDPYTGSLFTCDHNDNIDYQIKVLKEHFELELPEKFQTHVHAVDTSSERVNKTTKNEHESWYGQWQWRCGYERGWDKAMERKREWVGLTDEDIWQLRREGANEVSDKDFKAIEAKLKEKNT